MASLDLPANTTTNIGLMNDSKPRVVHTSPASVSCVTNNMARLWQINLLGSGTNDTITYTFSNGDSKRGEAPVFLAKCSPVLKDRFGKPIQCATAYNAHGEVLEEVVIAIESGTAVTLTITEMRGEKVEIVLPIDLLRALKQPPTQFPRRVRQVPKL